MRGQRHQSLVQHLQPGGAEDHKPHPLRRLAGGAWHYLHRGGQQLHRDRRRRIYRLQGGPEPGDRRLGRGRPRSPRLDPCHAFRGPHGLRAEDNEAGIGFSFGRVLRGAPAPLPPLHCASRVEGGCDWRHSAARMYTGVRATVDPRDPEVFSFEPELVEENIAP